LHGEEGPAVRQGADLVDGRNARVLQLGGQARLVEETPRRRAALAVPAQKQLDGERAAQVGVLGAEHRTHAAPADLLQQPIAPGQGGPFLPGLGGGCGSGFGRKGRARVGHRWAPGNEECPGCCRTSRRVPQGVTAFFARSGEPEDLPATRMRTGMPLFAKTRAPQALTSHTTTWPERAPQAARSPVASKAMTCNLPVPQSNDSRRAPVSASQKSALPSPLAVAKKFPDGCQAADR